MHELSIAISIVEIVTRQAGAESARVVNCVEMDIGTMSGIEYDSLESALGMAVKNTVLETTTFKINRIEALCECTSCNHLYTPAGRLGPCPECQGSQVELIKGKELKIKSLLIE